MIRWIFHSSVRASLFCAFLGASPTLGAALESAPETLLEEAGAEQIACPENVSAVTSGEGTLCGATDPRAKRVRKSLRKFLENHHPGNRGRPWVKNASWRYRHAMYDAQPYRVAVDVERDLLLVSREPVCFGSDFPADGVFRPDSEDLQHPKLTHKVRPTFPERARENRAQGTFDGWVWIDREGKVVDICTIAVFPERMGFEESAFEAVKRWRYRPAMIDDEPVPVLWYVWLEWTFGPTW